MPTSSSSSAGVDLEWGSVLAPSVWIAMMNQHMQGAMATTLRTPLTYLLSHCPVTMTCGPI